MGVVDDSCNPCWCCGHVRDLVSMQAFFIGNPDRQIFAVLHPASGAARACVLFCPPLLHEHQRSYRFFSQVADHLAEAGLACLRFDYFGTGDSGGSDADFSPSGTRHDIVLAARELRRMSGQDAVILLGIRGSALFACRDAEEVRASALCLWQPVIDGSKYLDTLQKRTHAEQGSRSRYPLASKLRVMDADVEGLMGFAVSSAFRDELAACRIAGRNKDIPMAVLDSAEAPCLDVLQPDVRHRLPVAVTEWIDQVDLDGLIPVRQASPALTSMIDDIKRWVGHG